MLDAKKVGPRKEDGQKAEHADRLVQNELGHNVPPVDAPPRSFQQFHKVDGRSLRAQAALLVVIHFLFGPRHCEWRVDRRASAGEEAFEQNVPEIAKLCLEEAVDGKFNNSLAVNGLWDRILGMPSCSELGGEVCGCFEEEGPDGSRQQRAHLKLAPLTRQQIEIDCCVICNKLCRRRLMECRMGIEKELA